MHIDLLKITGSLLGAFILSKILFWIFSPSEIIGAVLIYISVLALYGLQLTQWSEKSRISIFNIEIYSSEKVYQQYRIFGVIPISKKIKVENNTSFFGGNLIEEVILKKLPQRFLFSLLPFGALRKI